MSGQTYIASEGDTAEFIAWKFYGTQEALVVEKLLEANLGLADLGPELPAGTRVALPELDTRPDQQGVKLWD